jgi:hypothetical protein
MSPESADRIRTLIDEGLDWQALLIEAGRHGVTPLVSRQLLTHFAELVPAEWQAPLRAGYERVAQRNLYLAAEMIRLSGRFRAEDLMAIPYKGPLLAAQAYGDFALREFVDLDFAIRQRDLPRGQTVLLSEGYQAAFGETAPEEGSRPTHSEYQFIRPTGRVIVELQTETTLRYFPRPLDFDAMSCGLKQVELGGGELFSFTPEDTLMMLAVHGAKHFWERLLWIADIAELTQAEHGVVWEDVFARAAEMKVERMLRLALYVAHQMLDAPLPNEVLKEVQRDTVAKKLSEGIQARFFRGGRAPLPVFSRFRFRVGTRDTSWQGLGYALRLATSPTDPDREDMPLPAKLSHTHAWFRPLLLIRRYGVRRSKSGEPPKK